MRINFFLLFPQNKIIFLSFKIIGCFDIKKEKQYQYFKQYVLKKICVKQYFKQIHVKIKFYKKFITKKMYVQTLK